MELREHYQKLSEKRFDAAMAIRRAALDANRLMNAKERAKVSRLESESKKYEQEAKTAECGGRRAGSIS